MSSFFATDLRIPADRPDGHGEAADCEGNTPAAASGAGGRETTKEKIGGQGRETREDACGGKFGVLLEMEKRLREGRKVAAGAFAM